LNAGANIVLNLKVPNILLIKILLLKIFFFQTIIIYITPKLQPMESKIRYELEFPINSSPQLLYQYISTPSGLQEWFADNVNSRGEFFTFSWDDSEEKARLYSKKSGEKIKFKWMDEDNKDTEYYFEMRILVDEITKDVSLMVVDYAEHDDIEESKLLWENQVSDLKHVIGSV
jgi:uncharacterized protein YndB with AHSA1/START domain